MADNKPANKYRNGGISLAEWHNEIDSQFEPGKKQITLSYTLSKSWKDDKEKDPEKQWKQQSVTLFENDLGKVKDICEKAILANIKCEKGA